MVPFFCSCSDDQVVPVPGADRALSHCCTYRGPAIVTAMMVYMMAEAATATTVVPVVLLNIWRRPLRVWRNGG